MDAVEQVLNSGIAPLELYYQKVISCEFKSTAAYRSQLRINSLEFGVLTPEQYRQVSLRNSQCIELCMWNIDALCKVVSSLQTKKENAAEWVSAYTPVKEVLKQDLSVRIKKLFEKNGMEEYRGLCLEIPDGILYEDLKPVNKQLQELRDMGIKIALSGFGGEYCPVMRLADIQVDFVIADPYLLHSLNTDRSAAAQSAIKLVRDCGADVILDGAEQEDLEQAYRLDCWAAVGKLSGRYRKNID